MIFYSIKVITYALCVLIVLDIKNIYKHNYLIHFLILITLKWLLIHKIYIMVTTCFFHCDSSFEYTIVCQFNSRFEVSKLGTPKIDTSYLHIYGTNIMYCFLLFKCL